MPEEPLVELDAELKELSPMARRFLSSQGIATAKAFLSINRNTLANALMDWRKRYDSSECTFHQAQCCIYHWKAKLRKRQSSIPEEPLVELDAELKTDTAMGKSMEDDNASNDCFSLHQEYCKGAEPRDDSSKQKPDSKRKRPQDELCELQSNGINQTQDVPDETTLGAAAATPVSEVSVKTEQTGPLMWRKTTRSVTIRTFPLPAAVNEATTGKAKEDANASNDCVSHHHEDAMGAEPRDDSSKQKPDSKRKRLQDESSPKKCRYTVFWV
jgi:hypothetical protein